MSNPNEAQVGVYICHCGGNISDVVDVKRVAAELANYPHVAISREFPFMCSDAGQKLVIEDIQSGKINRVVIAACSPMPSSSSWAAATGPQPGEGGPSTRPGPSR